MRRLYLALGWTMIAAVVWLSLTPAPPEVDFAQSDKVGHLLSYAVLAFWFSQLYDGARRLFYLIGFVAMGLTLEFAQGALGYRTLDAMDMIANALGVLLGWGAALGVPTALPGAKKEAR